MTEAQQHTTPQPVPASGARKSHLTRLEQATLVALILAVAGALFWAGGMQGQLNTLGRPLHDHLKDLTEHAAALKRELSTGQEGPAGPVGMGMPIGSIVAFAGNRENVPDGWRVCDGSDMQVNEYPELYGVIGTLWGGSQNVFFKLPNLNGAFLRGVDFSGNIDKDRQQRNAARSGTSQASATAMPERRFTTRKAGGHAHSYAGVRIGSGNWQSGGTDKEGGKVSALNGTTSPTDDHMHVIDGGDDETRPYNYAVIYIIRAR